METQNFKCEYCDLSFNDNASKLKHYRDHHKISTAKIKNTERFKCHDCPITFTRNSTRKRHHEFFHKGIFPSYVILCCVII